MIRQHYQTSCQKELIFRKCPVYLETDELLQINHCTTTKVHLISHQISRINRVLLDIILESPFSGRVWRFTAWLPHTFPYKCVTEGNGTRAYSAIAGMKTTSRNGSCSFASFTISFRRYLETKPACCRICHKYCSTWLQSIALWKNKLL